MKLFGKRLQTPNVTFSINRLIDRLRNLVAVVGRQFVRRHPPNAILDVRQNFDMADFGARAVVFERRIGAPFVVAADATNDSYGFATRDQKRASRNANNSPLVGGALPWPRTNHSMPWSQLTNKSSGRTRELRATGCPAIRPGSGFVPADHAPDNERGIVEIAGQAHVRAIKVASRLREPQRQNPYRRLLFSLPIYAIHVN